MVQVCVYKSGNAFAVPCKEIIQFYVFSSSSSPPWSVPLFSSFSSEASVSQLESSSSSSSCALKTKKEEDSLTSSVSAVTENQNSSILANCILVFGLFFSSFLAVTVHGLFQIIADDRKTNLAARNNTLPKNAKKLKNDSRLFFCLSLSSKIQVMKLLPGMSV